ncbi:MAG: YfiR/HmsC family protein [Bacteroidales bacterium]|nr:YfiR/HmsC family protein [Bacteroidales bacterium]
MSFKTTFYILLTLFAFIINTQSISAQTSLDKQRAKLLYDLPIYLRWENDDEIEVIKIGVLNGSPSFLNTLREVTKGGYDNIILIDVINFKSVSDITETHLLYLPKEQNSKFTSVKRKLLGFNTALVSENYSVKKDVMINFITRNGRLTFEINGDNLKEANIKVIPEISRLGGINISTKALFNESEKSLKKEKQKVRRLQASIAAKQKELEEKEKEINRQKEILFNQNDQIVAQKEEINKQLSEQYVAINSQKDEIQNQAKLLESVNTELEKLSIVASETDNAVTIMDIKGNFQWINAGFTRLYGYTLQLLRNEIDDNIVGASSNPEVQNILNHIIETKQTGSYQNLSKTRNGNEIWVQTTITPILDENNEVRQLISIDTDITTEKKSEIEIRKQKDQIEIQNEQITSSINYAKTIQQAILPLAEDLEKYFESFLIFKPRDVVSGDFYWFYEKAGKDGKPDKIFIATVDCTGHGVPGAFMSMIGSRLLSEIVSEQNVTGPKDILTILDKKVKTALRQETTDNNDGMDMAVCVIEKEDTSYHITYSGAKSDLYYYSHKSDDITILSSERRSIGGTKQKRGNIEFTNKDFYLFENDIMWLSTDGIIDQNNADRKRFGTPKFIETLKEAKDLGLKEQKRLFLNKLDEHQGLEKQRDDITIWGIKFNLKKW